MPLPPPSVGKLVLLWSSCPSFKIQHLFFAYNLIIQHVHIRSNLCSVQIHFWDIKKLLLLPLKTTLRRSLRLWTTSKCHVLTVRISSIQFYYSPLQKSPTTSWMFVFECVIVGKSHIRPTGGAVSVSWSPFYQVCESQVRLSNCKFMVIEKNCTALL